MAPPSFFDNLGVAHREIGQYDKAIAAAKRALQCEPKDVLAYCVLITYMYAGREEEARSVAAELLKIDPDFSAEHKAAASPWKDPAKNERVLAALRKAGLK